MKKPFLFLWVVLAGIFLFSWIYLPAISRYQDLKTRQDGIEIQTKDLETKLKDTREERDLLKNDVGYLEKVIREELGLVKPGEIIYKVVEEKPAPKPAPAVEVIPIPGSANSAAIFQPVPPQSKTPALSVQAKRVPAASKPPDARPIASQKAASPAAKPALSPEPSYPRQETR